MAFPFHLSPTAVILHDNANREPGGAPLRIRAGAAIAYLVEDDLQIFLSISQTQGRLVQQLHERHLELPHVKYTTLLHVYVRRIDHYALQVIRGQSAWELVSVQSVSFARNKPTIFKELENSLRGAYAYWHPIGMNIR